jgi:hypothetical protein
VQQSPGFRAQPEARARALFGASARVDVVAADSGPGTPASAPFEDRDLARRIDAIDAKLDVLTRKIDSL